MEALTDHVDDVALLKETRVICHRKHTVKEKVRKLHAPPMATVCARVTYESIRVLLCVCILTATCSEEGEEEL